MENVKAVRTADDVLRQQRGDHNSGAIVPLTTTTPAVINDGLSYLASDASGGTVLRFNKDGKFIKPTQGDEEVPEGTQLVCHWDQARGGFQRFLEKGERPDVRIDLVFGGKPPERDELDDNDPATWPVSQLTGKQEDPWRKIRIVPLENPETGEILLFSTTSKTGIRAVSNLLQQAARMMAKEPNQLPVIKLRCGGYDDRRFGWVRVPAFEFIGKAPKTNIAAADTSMGADLDDEIPF
jgi:hypothetical protein